MEENAKRPKTARPSSQSVSRVSSVESSDAEKNLKYRQSLAARIKSEVVGKLATNVQTNLIQALLST